MKDAVNFFSVVNIVLTFKAALQRRCAVGKEGFAGSRKLKQLFTSMAETSYWSSEDERLCVISEL